MVTKKGSTFKAFGNNSFVCPESTAEMFHYMENYFKSEYMKNVSPR